MSLVLRAVLIGVLTGGGLIAQIGLRWYFEAPGPVPTVELAKSLDEFPMQLEAWRGVERPIEDEQLLYGDAHLSRQYQHSTRGQTIALWMAYSRTAADRQHNPEVCMAVAGKPEDPTARRVCPVEGPGGPVQQYRFGRVGSYQWVFYWHYTLPAPPNPELSQLQALYRQLRRRPSSMTLEVFAPEYTPEDAKYAREFVRLVDEAVRQHVGPAAIRGSRRLPVTFVEPEQLAKAK